MSTLDHNITKVDRRPWCHHPITYDHMLGDEIRSLWEFKQEWQRTHPKDVLLRHADVFKGYVQPHLSREKKGWDSYSVNPEFSNKVLEGREAHSSFEACRSACESHAKCLQFSYSLKMFSIERGTLRSKGYIAMSELLPSRFEMRQCGRENAGYRRKKLRTCQFWLDGRQNDRVCG